MKVVIETMDGKRYVFSKATPQEDGSVWGYGSNDGATGLIDGEGVFFSAHTIRHMYRLQEGTTPDIKLWDLAGAQVPAYTNECSWPFCEYQSVAEFFAPAELANGVEVSVLVHGCEEHKDRLAAGARV